MSATGGASTALSLPGLTSSVTVMLVYAFLWLPLFAVCMAHLTQELLGGLRERAREAHAYCALGGALATLMLLGALVGYVGAIAAVVFNALPDWAPQTGFWLMLITRCQQSMTSMVPSWSQLHSSSFSTLSVALGGHLLAELVRWGSAHPLRVERNRRRDMILAHLESQHDLDDEGPRSTVRYF